MFTIQYVDVTTGKVHMQDFDSKSRSKLVAHIAQTPYAITAVYEQATVITKTVRKELAEWPGSKSACALAFIRDGIALPMPRSPA